MKIDREGPIRRGNRFQAGIPALLHLPDGDRPCLAHDLSRSGVLLVGSLPSAPPDPVHFTLLTPKGDVRVRLRGKVVRHAPAEGDEEDSVAIEYLELETVEKGGLEVMLARVIEATAPGTLESLRPGAPPHEVKKVLESIPLPQRIALAVRAIPREREFLRQDPQPQVLDSLARNPNLFQAEALALAAVPHLLPTTLEYLLADLRWAQDEELRLLVLAHPHTPAPVADRLLAQLRAPLLKRLLQRNLPGPLREKAVRRLRQLPS